MDDDKVSNRSNTSMDTTCTTPLSTRLNSDAFGDTCSDMLPPPPPPPPSGGAPPRIGSTRSLQIFFFHSCNLLLNKSNLQRERVRNICCYTLDIYKLFIQKVHMSADTWHLLISILLRVAEFLFTSELVGGLEATTASHLIKLTTETCLSAMVKATLVKVNKQTNQHIYIYTNEHITG